MNLIHASGGVASDADFLIQNSSTSVLAFSLVGKVIPESENVLMIIEYEGDDSKIKLSKVIFSGKGGDEILETSAKLEIKEIVTK